MSLLGITEKKLSRFKMVSLLISLPKKLWDPKMELKPMAAPSRHFH